MTGRLLAVATLAVAVSLAACAQPTLSAATPAASPVPGFAGHEASPVPGFAGQEASRTPAGVGPYAGTAAAVPPAGTVSVHTLRTADGRARTYRLFVPDGGLGIAPLLIALHGGFGSGERFAATSGFDGLATSNRFLVAYPDGIGSSPDGSGIRTWNGGNCCGAAAQRNVDDVAFLRAVVLDVADSYAVDPNRVFATGHSNGGIMALRLACEASDMFAAVGVQSAALGIDRCSPVRPVSLRQIHGTADTNIPMAGGVGSGPSGVDFRPPRQAAQAVAAADGCRRDPASSTDPVRRDVVVETWPGCPSGTAVQFVSVAGAAHGWMVGPSGSPATALDSSRAIWSFVAAHPRTAVPGPVRRLRVARSGAADRRVVRWEAPRLDGGRVVTGYQTRLGRVRAGGGITWQRWLATSGSRLRATGPATRQVYSGLAPGRYRVEVRARNGSGAGVATAASFRVG